MVFVQGAFAALFAFFFLIPIAVDAYTREGDWAGFAFALFVCVVVGIACLLNGKSGRIGRREAVYLVCAIWVMLPMLAAIPFVVSSTTQLSYIDALFEAMSGLTTTGATVLSNLPDKSSGILLWRAMLNFIGGLGVVAVGMLLLPFLKVVGLRDVYGTESASARQYKFGNFGTVLCITCLYVVLLVMCALAYRVVGMSVFDALCHAMSTVSTGGFANYDSSLGYFNSAAVEVIAIVFMLLSSCPFVAYLGLIFDGRFQFGQFAVFVCMMAVFSLLVAINLYSKGTFVGADFLSVLRSTTFQLVSLATSTGFVNCDYSAWGFLATLCTILTLCGGCSGSTNSGLKIYRVVILIRCGYAHVRGILSRGHTTELATKLLREEALLPEVGAFFFVYVFVFCVACILVSWDRDDFATIVTSVSATLSNTGPGVGEVIGPIGTYASLSTTVKSVLIVLMLIGRLELVPVALLFSLLQSSAGRLSRIRERARKCLLCFDNHIR
ncbi:TrkH family potassium uptake protein [Anaplasma capra]|uniref:TrkH family potassium uptake protein n=1 Tax=Anaplasma capra TaxID=1562740 RepID=UPI0021D5FC34|nr:potassium transporter TrkG [Anaplasma capra]MCU7611302.1 TrkH family potassium uptake protein [Anaplasma capra]MCU7612745.1 TrkH family potassium uptake protein [Anaplasma capra]